MEIWSRRPSSGPTFIRERPTTTAVAGFPIPPPGRRLVVQAVLSGTGRLLDLACGPGRVTFAFSEHFADVLAIDQEEESVSYAKTLAAERGATHIKWRTGRAEISTSQATSS